MQFLKVVGRAFIQRLSRDDLQECSIALPTLKTQEEIVTTHRKLSALKEAINEFHQELSLIGVPRRSCESGVSDSTGDDPSPVE